MKKYILVITLFLTSITPFGLYTTDQKSDNQENCVISEEAQEPIIPIRPDADLTKEGQEKAYNSSFLGIIKNGFNWIIAKFVALKDAIVRFFKS